MYPATNAASQPEQALRMSHSLLQLLRGAASNLIQRAHQMYNWVRNNPDQNVLLLEGPKYHSMGSLDDEERVY